MILIVHVIFGAAIGSIIKNAYIAIILAFFSHYLLDIIPHIDYPIYIIEKKQLGRILPDLINVTLDFCLGLLLIVIFSKNQPIIYICGFSSAIPDLLTALYYLKPNKILAAHYNLHQKIHFLKHKKISMFWRVASQVAVVIISVILLKI